MHRSGRESHGGNSWKLAKSSAKTIAFSDLCSIKEVLASFVLYEIVLTAFPQRPATQRDGFCVNDSPNHSAEPVFLECFAQPSDIKKTFRELFAFFMICLHGLFGNALFYKLSENMLH